MGRKSLQTVRRAQIMDACEAIVLEEGLAAASPARVAGRVGLDRTTVHHYFRTRADLLGGLVERIVDGYQGQRWEDWEGFLAATMYGLDPLGPDAKALLQRMVVRNLAPSRPGRGF